MKAGAPERCRLCVYGHPVTVGVGYEILFACAYRQLHGHERDCPPGDECGKFEEKRKVWKIENIAL